MSVTALRSVPSIITLALASGPSCRLSITMPLSVVNPEAAGVAGLVCAVSSARGASEMNAIAEAAIQRNAEAVGVAFVMSTLRVGEGELSNILMGARRYYHR